MKKIILPIFIIIVCSAAVFFLVQRSNQDNAPAEQKYSEVTRGKQPDTYHLKFGHDMPEESAQHISALRFADIVDYKSSGRVKIEVFPGQKLGTDQQMLELARKGKLAICLPPTSKMTTLVPEMQVLDLPFLFPNKQDLYEILDGVPGKALLDKLTPHGLMGAAFWESGFKQFTANKPIRNPEDFAGLNIRVMKSRTIMEQFKAYGANPVPIDFHKTRQALEDGVVDGQENPLVSIINMKFHEVQSDATISNHAYLAQALVFSSKIFQSLPDDIGEILLATAKEVTPFERKEIIENEKKLIGILKKAGTRVHYLTQKEQDYFRAASRQVVNGFNGQGREILLMIQRHLEQKYSSKERELVIGLNADMSGGAALAGLAIQRGMELAASEINEQGGLVGRKMKILVRDNTGISGRGRDNMKYFSTIDNLTAVMCGVYSPIALAELDIVHKEKIVFLDPWAAATKIVDNGYSPNYVFRVSVRDQYAGPFLIGKALEKYKKISLLLVDDGWGRGNEKGMIQALALRNMEPQSVEWFKWGETDMSSKLDRIEESGAEVIVMVAGSVEGAEIIKSMAARDKKLPIISHWGITGGRFWKQMNRELEQISLQFLQSFSFFKPPTDKARNLTEKYFTAYNVNHVGEIFSPVGTAHAYDLVHLLAAAIRRADTIKRPAIRDALENIAEYRGVVRDYKPPFSPSRHDALDQSSFFLAEYNGNGYIIPVEE